MENKAYSLITEKKFSEDDDFFYVEGIASTPKPDRVGDVMKPMGAKFQTPMPLLFQHQHSEVLGNVIEAKPNAKGIPFKARLPKVKEPGRLKDRVDEAIQSVKYGLITAFSIGFRPIDGKYKVLGTGGIEFDEWDWFELSLVTIPMNPDAVLTAAKSMSHQDILAALGRSQSLDDKSTPGATGTKTKSLNGAVKLISKGK